MTLTDAKLDAHFESACQLVKDGRRKEALRLLELGIDREHGQSLWLAGALHDFGEKGVPLDRQLSAKYYQRSIASSGSWNAMMGLARLAFLGDGVPQNVEGAKELYELAYEAQEAPEAALMLANCILRLSPSEDERKRAIGLLRDAANSGNIHAALDLANICRDQGAYWEFITLRMRAAILSYRFFREGDGSGKLSKQVSSL